MYVYDQLQLRAQRRLSSAAFAVLLVPAVWYVRTDLALFPEEGPVRLARWALRLFLVLSLLVGLLRMRSVETGEAYSAVTATVAWSVALVMLGLNVLRPVGLGLPLRVPLFTIAVLYAAMPNALRRQVLPPLFLTAGLVALRIGRLDGGPSTTSTDLPGDVMILLALNLVGILLVRSRLEQEAALRTAWAAEQASRAAAQRTLAELRTLQGLIPICAHCKKVRTEVGAWQAIETYVRDRTHADFTHGICPDCLKREFP
ncbi:MAG TPA: hypothetical protein VK858_14050 [Longimicrobiales bacterium]|nr:hypothetical protein [Longimicrobiales bacterium]